MTAGDMKDRDDRGSEKENERDAARCRRVEDAIYKRARGYKVAVRKTYKVKRVEYDPDTGKKVSEREELQTGMDEVVVPADMRAGAYWLVNRDPARWREHPEPEIGEGESGGIVEYPPLTEPDGEDADSGDAALGEGTV